MKDEIVKIICEKTNEIRTTMHSDDYNRFSSSSTLKRIGNEIGIKQLRNVISDTNLFKIVQSSVQVIPQFLYDFIRLFVNGLNPKSIFDPCLTRDSYVVIENFKNFKGITKSQDEYELLTKGLLKDSNKITFGDGLENIINKPSRSDLIVSFPPFAVSSIKPNSTSKDYATDLLIESANKLNENGKLIFLMPQKFFFGKRIKTSYCRDQYFN